MLNSTVITVVSFHDDGMGCEQGGQGHRDVVNEGEELASLEDLRARRIVHYR